ncbi:hypothetical protein MNR01_16950 [Lysobacter sp. S4-A87]|uniref:hypothetical protein n=1 Tax=Lysobacter sp. S4-A87 TaxID=2925843 RepID=UPI001F537312|nr:hypothetical protein [Lysobacter sp. S4-A87]UNK49385.1 hypothetical protein MNR01_16950 [Lysobacter sp. S4-A87]
MVITRVGVLSVAKIFAIISAVFGLIAGVLMFLSFSVGGMSEVAQADPGMAWIAGMGALAIVILPIFYGVLGFIAGALYAWVYNVAARFVGGIEIETR